MMNLRRLWPWPRQPRTVCIGHLPVEAGCVLLIDPCQLRDRLFPGNAPVEDWYEQAVVARIDQVRDEHWEVAAPSAAGQAAGLPLGHFVISGAGDGHYPVEASYLPDGTLAEVRIRFLPARAERPTNRQPG